MYLSKQYSMSEISESSCLLSGRQRSSRFRLNEQPTDGMYNRNDFMARCYRNCWKHNARIGPQLRTLLFFGGQASTTGNCFSLVLFLFVMIVPLMSFFLLFPVKFLHAKTKIVIASSFLAICLVMSIWHVYSLYVVVTNRRKWVASWFAFEVPLNSLQTNTLEVTERFFDVRRHLKYFDVTKESLHHFPLLTKQQKQHLHITFNRERLNRARLMLYTQRFIASISEFSRNMVIFLLFISAASSVVSIYELVIAMQEFLA